MSEPTQITPRSIRSVLVTVRYAAHHMARLREALGPVEFVQAEPDDSPAIAQAL